MNELTNEVITRLFIEQPRKVVTVPAHKYGGPGEPEHEGDQVVQQLLLLDGRGGIEAAN